MSLIVPVNGSRTAAGAQAFVERNALAEKVREQDNVISQLQARNEALEALLRRAEAAVAGHRITGREIIAEISVKREMPIVAITGTSRRLSIVAVRHEAVYEVARRCPWMSFVDVGKLFGGRDHSTINHSISQWPKIASSKGIACLPLNRELVGDRIDRVARGETA